MPFKATIFFRGVRFSEIKNKAEKKKIAIRNINKTPQKAQVIPVGLETKSWKGLPKPKSSGPFLVSKSCKCTKSLVGKMSISCPCPPREVSPIKMLAIRGDKPIKKPITALAIMFFLFDRILATQ